jgi:hypothetical protein
VIRDLVLDAQAAEPPVRQVDLDLPTQQSFRADTKHITDDQHPDHEYWIDRRPADRGIIGCQLGVHPRQIENRRDVAHEVIVRHYLIKAERIEQLSLVVLQPPHHRKPPPLNVLPGRNHCSRPTATDFCNKICH